MKRLALLAVALLGLVAAADADPAVRGILTGAALIVGVVGALCAVGREMERDR